MVIRLITSEERKPRPHLRVRMNYTFSERDNVRIHNQSVEIYNALVETLKESDIGGAEFVDEGERR